MKRRVFVFPSIMILFCFLSAMDQKPNWLQNVENRIERLEVQERSDRLIILKLCELQKLQDDQSARMATFLDTQHQFATRLKDLEDDVQHLRTLIGNIVLKQQECDNNIATQKNNADVLQHKVVNHRHLISIKGCSFRELDGLDVNTLAHMTSGVLPLTSKPRNADTYTPLT